MRVENERKNITYRRAQPKDESASLHESIEYTINWLEIYVFTSSI